MTDLRIPPEHQRGLSKLFALPDPVASELLRSLTAAAQKIEADTLRISDLPVIAGLASSESEAILDTVHSLYRVRADADVGVEEFVSDVCEFLASSESKEFRLSVDRVGQFSARLTEFLGIDPLNYAAKAAVLRYEHERTVCHLRIITDARPVFGTEKVERPEAVVIFHMLKIAYHDVNRVKESFFSFDEKDLDDLRKAIERAEAKARKLKEVFAASNIRVISPA